MDGRCLMTAFGWSCRGHLTKLLLEKRKSPLSSEDEGHLLLWPISEILRQLRVLVEGGGGGNAWEG